MIGESIETYFTKFNQLLFLSSLFLICAVYLVLSVQAAGVQCMVMIPTLLFSSMLFVVFCRFLTKSIYI